MTTMMWVVYSDYGVLLYPQSKTQPTSHGLTPHKPSSTLMENAVFGINWVFPSFWCRCQSKQYFLMKMFAVGLFVICPIPNPILKPLINDSISAFLFYCVLYILSYGQYVFFIYCFFPLVYSSFEFSLCLGISQCCISSLLFILNSVPLYRYTYICLPIFVCLYFQTAHLEMFVQIWT